MAREHQQIIVLKRLSIPDFIFWQGGFPCLLSRLMIIFQLTNGEIPFMKKDCPASICRLFLQQFITPYEAIIPINSLALSFPEETVNTAF